jgi:hypothetical protein
MRRVARRPANDQWRAVALVVYWEAMTRRSNDEERLVELRNPEASSGRPTACRPPWRHRLLLLLLATLAAALAHGVLAPLLRAGFSQTPAWRLRLAVSLPALFLVAAAVGSGCQCSDGGTDGAWMERKAGRGEEIRDQ